MMLKNVAWIAFERLTRITISVFVTAMVARTLGAEQYGLLALVVSTALLVQTISQFGLDRVLIGELSKDLTDNSSLLFSALVLRVVFATLAGIAVLIWATLPSDGNDNILPLGLIISLTGTIALSFEVYEYWFLASTQNRLSSQARLIALTISATIKIALIYFNASLLWFIFAYASESLVIVASFFLFAQNNGFPGFKRTSYTQIKTLFHQTAPFGITAIGVFAYTKLDQLIIANQLGNAALGAYAAAMPFSTQTLSFIPVALCTSALPILAGPTSSEKKRQLLSSILAITIWVCLPIAVFISVLAPFLIQTLLGKNYINSAEILQVHVFSFLFSAIGMTFSYWIASTGNGAILVYKTFCTATLAVVLNIAFLPHFGIVAAAATAVIAEVFGTMFLLVARRKELLNPTLLALKISPASAVKFLRSEK